MKKILVTILMVTTVLCFTADQGFNSPVYGTDQREAAHGMNYVKNPVTGKAYLFWSAQYDTGSDSDGNWNHDVYYQELDLNNPKVTKKQTLISAKEAQEPASVSCTSDGNFFVTFEDGNTTASGGLQQSYAIYDKGLTPVKAYQHTIARGGHSGHGACAENKMICFWNNEWVDGGGVDNLGSGRDLYITTMNSDGTAKTTKKVTSHKRDWWPMLAASKIRAILVWQRFVKGKNYTKLCYAMFNPKTNSIGKIHMLKSIKTKYYTYNVTYLQSSNQYLINLSTVNNKGVALLLNSKGKLLTSKTGFPGFIRESAPALKTNGKTTTLAYPKYKSGIMIMKVSKNKISCISVKSGKYNWGYRGTSGFFTADNKVSCFATLTGSKMKIYKYKIDN